MFKFVCVLAVLALVSAQSPSSSTAYRLSTVDIGEDVAGNSFKRVVVGETFTLTVTGYNLQNGDRVTWVKNADTDCANAASAGLGKVSLGSCSVNANGLSTCTASGSIKSTEITGAVSTFNGALHLCYSRAAFDPYGNQLTVNYPWQYYGNLFKLGVIVFDSWKDSAENFDYKPVSSADHLAQRFWSNQILGAATNGGTLTLTASNIFEDDNVVLVAAAAGVSTTCSGASIFTSCSTAGDACTGLTVSTGAFKQDVKIPAAGTHFLCFQKKGYTGQYDTGLRSASRDFTASTALQFMFPTHALLTVDGTNPASFASATQTFRVGMWAVRKSDKFALATSLTASTTFADCSATAASGVVANGPVFTVDTITSRVPGQTTGPELRSAVIKLTGTNKPMSETAQKLTGEVVARLIVCYAPEGTQTSNPARALTTGGTGGEQIGANTNYKTAPFGVDDCDTSNAGTVTSMAEGIFGFLSNDFSYPKAGSTEKLTLLQGVDQQVFWQGCVEASTTVGVNELATCLTPVSTMQYQITDATWPLMTINPKIAATTTTGTLNLCYGSTQVKTTAAAAVVYDVFTVGTAVNTLVKTASGSIDNTKSYAKPTALSTVAGAKSATWFMSGWISMFTTTSIYGSALNYWSGTSATADLYQAGNPDNAAVAKTEVLFTYAVDPASDVSCATHAATGLRYSSTVNANAKDSGTVDAFLPNTFVRNGAALTCTYPATGDAASLKSCVLGNGNTPDVSKVTDLTMCVRVIDGAATPTFYSTWVKTAIKIKQYPKLFIFPDNLTKGLTASPNFYLAGIAETDAPKLGLIDTAGTTGLTATTHNSNSRCAATLNASTSPKNSVATVAFGLNGAGQPANPTVVGGTYAFCISRGSVSDSLIFIRSSGTATLTVLDTTTIVGADTYSITNPAGTYTALAGAGDSFDIVLGTKDVKFKFNFKAGAAGLSDATNTAVKISKTAADCGATTPNDVITNGVASWTNTWVVNDNGLPAATQTVGAEITVPAATAVGVLPAKGVICWNGVTHTPAANLGIRIIKISDSCNTAACDAVLPAGTTVPIKVKTYGNYYPLLTGATQTTVDIVLDAYNVHTSSTADKVKFTFYGPNDATVPGFTNNVEVTSAGTPATAGNALVTFTNGATTVTAIFQSALDTGVFTMWAVGNRNANTPGFSTGKTLTVVNVASRYPALYLGGEANTLYFGYNYGVVAGSTVYFSTDATTAACPAYTTDPARSPEYAVTVTGGVASVAAAAISSFTAATYKSLCYKPSSAGVYSKVLDMGTNTLEGATAVTTDVPTVTSGMAGTNSVTFEGTPLKFIVNLSSQKGYIQDSYFPLIVDTSSCAAEVTGTNGAVKATAMAKTADTKLANTGHTITAPALTLGKTDWEICWPKKTGASAAGDWPNVLTQKITVRAKPTGFDPAAANFFLVVTADTTVDQKLKLGYAATGVLDAEKLAVDDALCLVPTGKAGPTTAGSIMNAGNAINPTPSWDDPTSTTTPKATITAYCLATTATFDVNFKTLISSIPKTHNAKYDVWVIAGAKTGSLATPFQVPAVSVTTLAPDYRPYTLYQGGSRTLYASVSGDSYGVISSGTVTDCSATGAAAPVFAASTVGTNGNPFSVTAGATGTQNVCYKPAASATTMIAIRSNSGATALTTPAFAQGTDNLVVPPTGGLITVIAATNRYMRFHANVDTTLYFPYTTSAAQAGDIFKFIKYDQYNAATSKDCDTAGVAAGDFLADNTALGGWTAPGNSAASVWVKIAKLARLPTTLATTAGAVAHTLPLCWLQNQASATVKKIPGSSGIYARVVDIDNFRVAAAAGTTTVEINPGTPRGFAAFTAARVYFSGHWLEADDFASFVPKSAGDCSTAWFNENAIYSAATASATSAIADYRILLEGGLPGGIYNLCFWAANTHTGYRLYDDIVTLRSFDVTISPMTASSGIATVFTFKTYGRASLPDGSDNLVGGIFSVNDKIAFAVNGASACSGVNTTNVTAADGATATLTTTNAVDKFTVCADFAAGLSAQNLACYYGGPADCSGGSTVTVYKDTRLVAASPATLARGIPTDVIFSGSFLNRGGADAVNFSTVDSCTTNNTFATLEAFGSATEQNQAIWRGYSQNVPGLYYACYRYALNQTTPVGNSAVGVSIVVAGVDSITPTGQDSTTFAANDQTITLTGLFNRAQSSAGLDYDYVGLIKREAKRRDCSGLNLTNAFANPVSISGSTATATSGTIVVNYLDAGVDADYSLCVHFAGMPWSAIPSDRDFVLIDQTKVTFSRRSISNFIPRSIVNGTNTDIRFFGFGIANDSVAAVPTTQDCTTTAPGASAIVPVTGNKATLNLPAGTYRLCYKFKDSANWFPVLTSTDTLLSEAAQVKTFQANVKGAATNKWDVTDSARIVLSGTGLAIGDKARLGFFNATTPLNCDSTTNWAPVAPVDPLANGNFFFDVPAATYVNGTYALCYQWGASGPKTAYNGTAFQVTITAGPRVLGIAPRMIDLGNGTTQFAVFGAQLSTNDKVALVPVGTACPATGTAQLTSVGGAAGQNFGAVAIAITGAANGGVFTLCYYSGAAGVAVQQINSAVWVNDPAVQCGSSKKFRCGGSCSATPCVAAPADFCASNPLAVQCPGTAFCARTQEDCFAIAKNAPSFPACPANKPQRCFDGTCALNLFLCPPVNAPAPASVRCTDGSTAAPGGCPTAAVTCKGITAAKPYCDAAGGCPINAATDLTQCPPANGCPSGQVRCSDCTCQTDCASRSFPTFLCADGSRGTTPNDCPRCWRHAKFAQQMISTNKAARRRFVVRGSAVVPETALTATNANGGTDTIATIQIDADIAVDDNCVVVLSPVADSVVDAAAGAGADGFLAGPTVFIAIVSTNSTTPVPCNLNKNNKITLTFPNLETGTVNFAAYFSGANLNATLTPVAGSPNKVQISGTGIWHAIAPYFGTKLAPVTIPAANGAAPTPSVSVAPSTSGAVVPSTSVTAVPSGPAASGSPSGSTTSASIGVSVSTLLVAVVLSVLAMLI